MSEQTPVKTTAKTAGISTLLIGLTQLPAPYSHWAGDALMFVGILGIIGTQIPAPKEGSKWELAYRVLSFLAANWGQALNAGMAARSTGKKNP